MKPKHKLFCAEYIKDFNAAQAAIRAGYSANGARQTAHKLLTTTDIQKEVQRLQDELKRKSMLSAEDVVVMLADLASNAPRNSDRLKALDLLGKYHGLYVDRVRNEGEMMIAIVPPPKPKQEADNG